MSERIVLTICSRKKSAIFGLVPAVERYLGLHIQVAAEAARPQNIPFFILSGKFGLVAERQGVPNYNYRLEWDSVDQLVSVVARDLSLMRVRMIDFYIEPNKDSWEPYIAVIEQAAERVGAKLNTHEIRYE